VRVLPVVVSGFLGYPEVAVGNGGADVHVVVGGGGTGRVLGPML